MKRNKNGWATIRLASSTLKVLSQLIEDPKWAVRYSKEFADLAKGNITGITIGGINVHIVRNG